MMIPDGTILTRTRGWLAGFVTGGVMAGLACAPVRPATVVPATPLGSPPQLTWISEFTRPNGAAYPQLAGENGRFGSLSGLAHDVVSGQWLAVVDDRLDTRVAWLSITATEGRLDVVPTRLQRLRAGPGVAERVATEADLEAVAALSDGTFVMSEEGHATETGVWQPAILHVTADGEVTAVIDYPAEFKINPGSNAGVRDNQGFESLTRTPAGRLIAGLEQPLANRPLTTTTRGGDGWLIEFEPRGQTWAAARRWRYLISPTPTVPGFPTLCADGENGLVELLALTETTLIAMERACWLNGAGQSVNPVRLFTVTLDGTTARKTLLLDLATIAPKLSPSMAHLDNFEALAFGPLVDGRPTLLVLSDDNFRKTQFTSFLLFGMGSVPK